MRASLLGLLVALSLSVSVARAADSLVCQGTDYGSTYSAAGKETKASIPVPPTGVVVDLDRRFVVFAEQHIPITNVEEVSAGGTTIYFEGTNAVPMRRMTFDAYPDEEKSMTHRFLRRNSGAPIS